ncbi:MAG: PilZ domain-containing protein [Candidatus Eremiobacterota bacterium]
MYWNSSLWNAHSGGHDPRRARRFVRYAPARLYSLDGKLLAEGFSLDLSMDGARLQVNRPIPEGTPVRLAMTARNQPFRMFCMARVVADRAGRCHVRFGGRSKSQLHELARYLESA